jgi:YD repeat-containing protein
MVFSVWKEGRWISILMIVEMVIGPLLFYGFGIVKSTTLSFTLAMCWLLTAVFYFKLDQNEKRLGHGRGWYQGGGKNNGSVVQITNGRDSTRTAYTYDQLNRLATAQMPGAAPWGDSYVYDAWGNLLQKEYNQRHGGEHGAYGEYPE